ncbi:MAG: hypothetical protein DRG78_00310 [Epsilonproteobacteria bacterium]|nr:MAG: hypothetical protein DRG78_00310 [Campylobacterota bacterium]
MKDLRDQAFELIMRYLSYRNYIYDTEKPLVNFRTSSKEYTGYLPINHDMVDDLELTEYVKDSTINIKELPIEVINKLILRFT